MELPNQVRIIEVGPRDGLQNESVCLSVESRVQFIKKLIRCGLTDIECGSFVHPKWVPQMADSGQVLAALPSKNGINFPVLVPNRKGMDNALKAGAKEIAIFAAASETFSQKNINCSIAESLERFKPVVKLGLAHKLRIRGYISCVMGCPYEGKVNAEAVVELAQQLVALGCYEVSLGDTIGVGTPLQTEQLLDSLLKKLDKQYLAVHFHDTYGQALANILIALQMGVSSIDAAVAGLGGCSYAKNASGNVATEDVVYMLNGLDIKHGVDLDKLIKVGRFVCNELKRPVMSRVNLAKN